MARKIIITSGKGGVGKTTITVNLGLTLAKSGYRVMLIDGDFGLNNLDVVSNIDNLIVFDLLDVLNGKCRCKQALVESPNSSNLFILPCKHSLSNVEISGEKLKKLIFELDNFFDYIFIDSPAGIELGFHRAVSMSTEAIIVVTPTISSVRDADKVLAILKTYKLSSIKLIVNKIRGDLVLSSEMFSASEISKTLNIDLLGVIPSDDDLLKGVIDNSCEVEKTFKIIAKALNGKTDKVYDYLKKYTGFWGSIRKELKRKL